VKKIFAALVLIGLLAIACGDPVPKQEQAGGGGSSAAGTSAMCAKGHEDCNDMMGTPSWDDGSCSVPGYEGDPDGDGSPAPPEMPDCATGGGSSGDDGTVSSGTVSPDPGDGGSTKEHPQMVKPRSGMADLHKVDWDKARVSKDGRKVRVTFWSGVEPCYVLDHIDVEYGEDSVTITLWEGHDPEHADEACIEIAVLKGTRVKLSEPLGDRAIEDGAE
jgi:hypothetical protein